MSKIAQKWAKMKGVRIFFSIYSYIHLWKNFVICSSPKNGGIVYRECVSKQSSTFHLHSKDFAYNSGSADSWFMAYITSGLCNHSLISHLGFPTTKIGQWYQWYCSLIGHHYADLSTWCNTLIRHGKWIVQSQAIWGFPWLCNDKPSRGSQDCAIIRRLGFPRIVQS